MTAGIAATIFAATQVGVGPAMVDEHLSVRGAFVFLAFTVASLALWARDASRRVVLLTTVANAIALYGVLASPSARQTPYATTPLQALGSAAVFMSAMQLLGLSIAFFASARTSQAATNAQPAARQKE